MKTTMRTIRTGKDLIAAAVSELAADAIPPTDSNIVSKIRGMNLLVKAEVEIWKEQEQPEGGK